MKDERIIISWQMDDSNPEKVIYSLVSEDPAFSELMVSIPAGDGVTERTARAKLIEAMFNKAHELKIDVSRLRFHV